MVKKVFWQAATVAWMIVIFLFSNQPATESGELSDGLLFDILNFLNVTLPQETVEFLSMFIRKAAHFSIYAVLGALVFVCVGKMKNGPKHKKRAAIAEGVCFCYAASDEIHQFFVPGRSTSAADVLLDSCGAATAIIMICALCHIVERRKKNG